jgi:exosortase E/protease (VPEID-CTERM system)
MIAILLGEYAVVAVYFDGGTLVARGGWLARFSEAGEFFAVATVVLSAALLMHFRQLRAAFVELGFGLPAPHVGWVLAHFAAFALCLACGFGLFARTAPDATGVVFVLVGALAGGCAAFALARGLFGPAVLRLGKVLARAAAAGAVLGVCAWQAGLHSRPLWPQLAKVTLAVSAGLLRSVSSTEVRVHAATATLGLAGFDVEIGPACSGVEGMVLVVIFVGGYIYRFRSELAVGRALLLVPVAVALAWLANALRIAALVALGAWWSPEIAFGGFHSKAGWVLFCSIALGVVTLLDRTRLFARAPLDRPEASQHVLVDNPTAGYCMPFLSVLAVGMVSGLFSSAFDSFYWLRLVAAGLALYWGRGYVRADFAARASWLAPLWGVAVFLPWLWLTPVDAEASTAMGLALARLSPASHVGWVVVRLLGTVVMAPCIEELAFRGFLQRRLVTRDFDELPYARVSIWGVVGSALAFGALHPSWLLGTGAGIAYCIASRRRGGLVNAILAHGTTNLLLAAWALAFARFDLLR